MNESKCPVPREQQPTNEFIELSKSKIFSWPKTKKSLILILIKFWLGAFVLFLIISSGSVYFKSSLLKYTLPQEMIRNRTKAPTQNFIKIRISDFFVLGQENMVDFDNSINSFVGCCSLGTGHLDSFIIKDNYGKLRLSPLLQNDSRS